MLPVDAPRPFHPERDSPRILVVEDEVLIRTMVSEALRAEGYQVTEAGNADEAIALLAAGTRAALVFSDVNMPGERNGVQLAKYVHEKHPGIIVVLTSAVGHPDLEGEIFLPKPFGLFDVVAFIVKQLPGSENRE